MERQTRKCGYIHFKVFRLDTAYCIYSLRNSTATDFPFRFGVRHISCNILARACKYNERCANVDKKTIDSAKVLNVSKPTMLFSVILPAALSQIFIGCNQGLSVSFILLTSAEMIGAQNGMGYYIKQYSDFGDYTRTIVGLLVIGAVIMMISFLFNKLQGCLLRWKR